MKRITPPSPAAPEFGGPTVLYVEDERSNFEVTELRLRRRYQLLWARTDDEACELVRRCSGNLHAVLMDLQLKSSTLDGLALTRALRGLTEHAALPEFAKGLPAVTCPIFLVTAYGALHSREQMQAVGADGLVPKPVDFLKLTLLLADFSARKAAALAQAW